MSLKEKLGKELLFFDGAMGTMLQDQGLAPGELPELWNLTRPDVIQSIHAQYLEAGCDIVSSNTFGANSLKLRDSGYSVQEVASAGISCARRAVEEAGHGYVALDLGPTGKLLQPCGDLAFEDAYTLYAEIVQAGEKGADLILIETMSDTYEVKAALLAAREHSSLPVIVTLAFDETGKLLTGADIPTAVNLIESLGADALGFNCGLGPRQMKELLPSLTEVASLPVVINPNAGLPVCINGVTQYNVEPDEFAEELAGLVEGGAAVVGGCCGTTPAHIRALTERCRGKKPHPVLPKYRTAVSSYSKTVVLDRKPVIIGERINPTGKKRLKQALREQDMEYLYREALTQAEHGADILDVNVGLPEIDEPAMMERAVAGIQSITDLPLQIDTSDPEAMARALRLYNGRPLINSVNGKQESMDTVLPLVKKYGAIVVALTLDESGIPDTAEGRIAIAQKIVREAERYGIGRHQIVVDPLAMTISTGADNANTALRALRVLRDELHVHTVLGVSNISFGLPQREHINSTFFAMAMSAGLSAGIVNPSSDAMMDAYYSYCALSGCDEACGAYISRFSAVPAPDALPAAATQNVSEPSLHDAVVKGLKEQAHRCAEQLVQSKEPLSIINEELIPALDEVGKGFENHTLFLPQLLMSADAAKAAFDALKDHMVQHGLSQEKRGKIILATVKGDIHDIGKNIVKVLLENYSFDVIDLGRDVDPQVVVDTAVKEKVRLVGLSALMTTTVSNMEITIRELRKVSDCKIMVGGAVLTEDYAKAIGADFYSKDAMGSVHYANELFC